MKLTKKHIGQLFDCRGGDGSWAYQLIDINTKTKEVLFYAMDGEYWAFKNTYTDWRPFEPQEFRDKKEAWAMARRENF
jgi:hypothetical protein